MSENRRGMEDEHSQNDWAGGEEPLWEEGQAQDEESAYPPDSEGDLTESDLEENAEPGETAGRMP